MQKVGRELAGAGVGSSVGSGIGFAIGGGPGGMVGAALGGALGKALQSIHEAGVQNIEHLNLLMTKVTRQNENRALGNFNDQMRRVSLVGTVQATSQQPAPAQPQARPVARAAPIPMNLLFAPSIAPPPMRRNVLVQ